MEDEYFQIRTAKLKALRDAGVNPYPSSYKRTNTAAEAIKIKIGAKKIRIAGRIMLIRDMGKICFSEKKFPVYSVYFYAFFL